jgi:hypothetical protein
VNQNDQHCLFVKLEVPTIGAHTLQLCAFKHSSTYEHDVWKEFFLVANNRYTFSFIVGNSPSSGPGEML